MAHVDPRPFKVLGVDTKTQSQEMTMTGTAKGVFALSFMLALWAAGAAMAGIIEGTIKDSKTGDALVGATVRIVNSNLGASANIDGRYVIANVNPGIYSLRVSYANYLQKVLPGVAVTGNDTTSMDITMEPAGGVGDAQHIDDTYVTGDRIRNNIVGELAARQRSAVIGDGMTQEQIRLSPDRDAGDALKRVTGLSVVDDKFVFVRGVTDRYNSTTLNGATVTGTDTDSDKKSFSFDLIPSSLIASTIVAKTATPDLPGDFSGGLVQVNTLDLPSKFMLTAGVEAASDNVSSRKDIRVAPGGGSDWKAQDDGTRAMPPGKTGVALAKALPNSWATSGDESNLNSNYGVAIGDRFNVGAGQLGFIASGTYKNTFKIEDYHQQPQAGGLDIFKFDGKRYKEKYLWGGLANVSWHVTDNHRISFENNYTRTADDKVTEATGVAESQVPTNASAITWAQRDLYLGQLKGQHTLSFANGLDIKWRLTTSTSSAQEPDRKFAAYGKNARGYYLIGENYRTWSELGEDTHGGALDVQYPVGDGFVKAGYALNHRERDYHIDAFAASTQGMDRKYASTLPILPIDAIFAPENFGKDTDGKQMFDFIPYTVLSGTYNGEQDLNAYYGMYDSPFKLRGRGFRFAGGVRVEDSDQTVNGPKASDDPTLIASHSQVTDALPSGNLTAEVTRTSNIRLGYYKSVNRPEIREQANVAYLDFDRNQTVVGNSDLKRATIQNYDVRAEWFPKPGEVIAASYFYKGLTDAIEEQLLPSPDRYIRTWFNSPTGKNFGYEIELRKGLGFMTGALENLVVQANYTHVDSEVEYTESYNDSLTNTPVYETKTRPLQGQAPYTVNAGLTYSLPAIGLSTSLLFNRFGRRLDAVGDSRDEDIYEEPRNLLDFALTEQFTSWVRLKFTMKDLLADDKVLTFGNSGSTWERVNAGTTYALSLSFSL
jgi:TonB-dependent receptor